MLQHKYNKQSLNQNNMTKKIFIVLLSSITLFACKKKTPTPPPAPTMVGLWKGSYLQTGQTWSSPCTYVFYANGTMSYFQGSDTMLAQKYTGIYVIKNNRATIGYTKVTSNQSFLEDAVLNVNFNSFEGTWGVGQSATDGGTMKATKQ
jgi:hypothetical protein